MTRDGGEECERRLLLEHVHLVERHSLLSDKDLFGSLDDKVTARVIRALADTIEELVVHIVQQTHIRSGHDGDLSRIRNCH